MVEKIQNKKVFLGLKIILSFYLFCSLIFLMENYQNLSTLFHLIILSTLLLLLLFLFVLFCLFYLLNFYLLNF